MHARTLNTHARTLLINISLMTNVGNVNIVSDVGGAAAPSPAPARPALLPGTHLSRGEHCDCVC